MPRVSHQLTAPKQAEFCDVTLEAAAIRLYEHQDPPPEKQHLKISCTNSKMMFGQGGIDGESIFKLVDYLHRRVLGCSATPWTICSLSNRRLTAFLKAGELLADARACFHASFKS